MTQKTNSTDMPENATGGVASNVLPLRPAAAMTSIATQHPGRRPEDPAELEAWEEAYEAWYISRMDAYFGKLVMQGKNPKPVSNAANAEAALRLHPELESLLAFDQFKVVPYLMAPIPGTDEAAHPDTFTPRELTDADAFRLLTWLQRNGLPSVSKEAVWGAIGAVAQEATFDPLRDYVERCEWAWDGKHRMFELFSRYLVAAEQNAYTEWLGEAAMMTLVLRALEPGAFQKMVPILEGPQDIGKSSALLALSPDPLWFGGDPPDKVDGKDAKSYLRGLWIVELAELSAMRKAEIEALKGYLTTQRDRFRPPYGRGEVTVGRRCMFWGTTNDADYLKDRTGNVRFYPVGLSRIDLESIRRDRDQLIGEAVVTLKELQAIGGKWWEPPDDARAFLREVREARQEVDPWLADVETYVSNLFEVTPNMILGGSCEVTLVDGRSATKRGLGFEASQMNPATARRVSGILRQLGWKQDGRMPHGHKFARATRFVRRKDSE
jgi:predicted P-loop ATPase